MNESGLELFARIAGYVVLAVCACLLLAQLKRFFVTALRQPPRKCRAARGNWWMPLIAFLASRIFIAAVVLIAAAARGEMQSLFSNLQAYVNRWDGPHYVSLIENGYVTTGNDRLFVVFFPLYPMICRALGFTGLSALARALIVSNVAGCLSGYLLYALVLEEGSQPRAQLATALLMFNPVSFFMSMPYTESIFLTVTIAAVLLARRRKFALAVIMGAIAATARMVGLAVAAPVFWEMLNAKREEKDRLNAKDVFLCVARTLPMLAGLAAYLILNYSLFGNPLQFLEFQRENWSNQMTLLSETVRYVLINAVQYPKMIYRIGTWIPEIIAIVATIALSASTLKRQHPGDGAFLAIAFYLSVSLAWLISGVRYVTGLYAIYPMLALLPKRKNAGAAMLLISAALLAYMTVLGINIGYVL